MSILDYDVKAMVDDLHKKLRIEDWDTEIILCKTKEEAEANGSDPEFAGTCTKNRCEKTAKIVISLDDPVNETDFDCYMTIVHEVAHILTDDFCVRTEEMIEFTPKNVRDVLDNQLNLHYERHNQLITRAFVNILGENYLNQFKSSRDALNE